MNNKSALLRFAIPTGRLPSGLLLSGLLILSTAVNAELRVIVQYNADGHSLLRAVELGESGASELTGVALGNPTTHVAIKWFSAEGKLLHSGSIADPRLIHTPLSESGSAHQLVGLASGAYMVQGPTGSAILEVSLPANPSLGLYSHTFRINLSGR